MPTARRRRNPAVVAHPSTYARLAKVAELPLVPKSDLATLSDDELDTFADAYDRALISLDGDIEEEEEVVPGRGEDKEYLAAARAVYAELKRYFTETVVPLDNARSDRKQKALREKHFADLKKSHEAKLRLEDRLTAEMAAQDATAGVILSKRASVRGYLGKEVQGPKGRYRITGVGDGEDSNLRVTLARGIPDKRIHSGAWFLLEEVKPSGPKRDVFIISVSKG